MCGLRYLLYLILIFLFGATAQNAKALNAHSVNHHGKERSYYTAYPAHQPTKNMHVVIVLHGGGGNGQNAAAMTGFDVLAEREGFIAVFPDGNARGRMNLRTWNATHCCAYAMKSQADDVGFLTAVIDDVVKRFDANADAVFMTGLSNGGMMTHHYAAARPDKLKAAAPVISGLFGDEVMPNKVVPMLFINSVPEESIPVDGGHTGGRAKNQWDGTPLKPIAYQAAFWSTNNGCKAGSQTTSKYKLYQLTEYNCPKNADVLHYVTYDGGHSWPGGQKGTKRADAASEAFNATDLIWSFFKSKI
ncbi:MAG: PHB depolymerase family esterase [Pseudomonadota bacterium]|nr:PHB depolymerase family esterase [Pseudomonadota bacterium]